MTFFIFRCSVNLFLYVLCFIEQIHCCRNIPIERWIVLACHRLVKRIEQKHAHFNNFSSVNACACCPSACSLPFRLLQSGALCLFIPLAEKLKFLQHFPLCTPRWLPSRFCCIEIFHRSRPLSLMQLSSICIHASTARSL